MLRRRPAVRVLAGLVGLFALIQLVPYGRSHANPAVSKAVRWNSPETARLAAGACMDCHSNLTNWRWYSNVAPTSWLVQHDVEDARKRLNFSQWNTPQPSVDEMVSAIRSGSMPPLQYKLIHADSRLSKSQRDALARGIAATYKADPPPVRSDHGDDG